MSRMPLRHPSHVVRPPLDVFSLSVFVMEGMAKWYMIIMPFGPYGRRSGAIGTRSWRASCPIWEAAGVNRMSQKSVSMSGDHSSGGRPGHKETSRTTPVWPRRSAGSRQAQWPHSQARCPSGLSRRALGQQTGSLFSLANFV